jgi:hypothetical protein
MNNRHRLITEINMESAVELYFKYGIHPGSCTSAILAADYEEAYMRAHPHIKDRFEELYNNMRLFCTNAVCEAKDWKGYVNASEGMKAIIILEAHEHTYKWIKDLE